MAAPGGAEMDKTLAQVVRETVQERNAAKKRKAEEEAGLVMLRRLGQLAKLDHEGLEGKKDKDDTAAETAKGKKGDTGKKGKNDKKAKAAKTAKGKTDEDLECRKDKKDKLAKAPHGDGESTEVQSTEDELAELAMRDLFEFGVGADDDQDGTASGAPTAAAVSATTAPEPTTAAASTATSMTAAGATSVLRRSRYDCPPQPGNKYRALMVAMLRDESLGLSDGTGTTTSGATPASSTGATTAASSSSRCSVHCFPGCGHMY